MSSSTASILSQRVSVRAALSALMAGLAILGTAATTSCTRNADAAEGSANIPIHAKLDKIDGQEIAVVDRRAECAAADHADARHQGHRQSRGHRKGRRDRRQRSVSCLDFWLAPSRAKFIRVREGDLVEFHLTNASTSMLPHNIDLHAVTGPGVVRKRRSRWRAANRVQLHRAQSWTLRLSLRDVTRADAHGERHVRHDPRRAESRTPKVDREFYVMQSEFYAKPVPGGHGLHQIDMDNGIEEKPTYVGVQWRRSARSRATRRCKRKVGERVRIFFGDAGPNLTSSFHVIGEVFDNVYADGGRW
jgi:nitrite reductase (NO-forming)